MNSNKNYSTYSPESAVGDIPFIEEKKVPPPLYLGYGYGYREQKWEPKSPQPAPQPATEAPRTPDGWDDAGDIYTKYYYSPPKLTYTQKFLRWITADPFTKDHEDCINQLMIYHPLLRNRPELATKACFALEVSLWSVQQMEYVLEKCPELEWTEDTLKVVLDKLELAFFIDNIDNLKCIFVRSERNGNLYYGTIIAVAVMCGAEDIANQLDCLFPDIDPLIYSIDSIQPEGEPGAAPEA